MDKNLKIKINIDSETAKLDALNSKINTTSKGFNQADSMASAFTSRLDVLNGKMKSAFDSKPIDDLVKRTLDPYGAKLDEINQKWQNNLSIMQKNGKNTSGVFSAWNKEIKDLETSKLDSLNGKVNTISKGFKQADSVASDFTNGILALGGAYLSLNAAINAGKMFVSQADSMKLLDARLKLATSSTAEYESQQKKLLKTSLDTYTPLSNTITLFTRLNPALSKVGADTLQVNQVISSFTKGLQLGGSTVEETNSAILQFSQAMGSGALRGEEFNAIADASSKLLEYIAKGLGVASTELRNMAENGELTSLKVSNALLKVKSDIDRDFATLPITASKAMTNAMTELAIGIKDIDSAIGITDTLAKSIERTTLNIGSYTKSVIGYYQEVKNFLDDNKTLTETMSKVFDFLGKAGDTTLTIATLDTVNNAFKTTELGADEIIKKIDELEQRKASLAQNKYKDSNEKTINLEIEALQSKLKLQEQFAQKQIQANTNIIPLPEKTAVTELIGEFEGYSKTIDKITEKVNRSDSSVIKIMGTEYQKFNLELEENVKKLIAAGATESEINKYRVDSNKDFNEKQSKANQKTFKEQEKNLETLSQAYSETAQIGMSDYNKSLISIADKVAAWTKAGVDNIEILRVQGILLDELNQKQALETTKTDLSYYERKVQLQTESYEKELELQGISYGQKVLDIEGSSGESAEKERLIELEAELYNATVSRMELERNTEFQETISGFYDDMLESQLELNSALYDFGDGFGEVGNKIAGVSKSLATMQNADLKSKKELAKLDDKYAKEFKKYSKDKIKTKELTIAYEEEEQQLKEQILMNQIGGLSEFAGQSKQFFGEQTTAYKTLQAIEAVGHAARMTAMAAELPGQITSLSVNIANALAGQGSIPVVGFALVVGMAALLAGLGVMSAGGGGGGGASGGGGSKKPSQFDIREQELEDLYTPMTDRLDRQIELLESIDKQGSASALSLIGSKISFEKDYALAVNEINKKLPTDVRGYGLDFNNALAPIEAALGFNIADVIRIKKSGWDKSEKRIYTDFGALNSGYNMMKLISAYFEDTSKNSAIAALFGGHNALNLAANELQATLGDFTSGIVDSLDDLKDASSDFKDHYDTITGSMHYENKKLAQAFSDVQALTNGKTFAEYLKQNIDEIDTLSNTFSDAVVNTLLSQDPADMAKQLAVLEDLQNQTGLVFKGGAKDALDFLESIELVATAMSTSSSNIKDFIDGFKSEDLLALDLSNKLGTNLALNYDDLALKFKDMASDIYGLTDAELEFLDANKSYIERIQDAKKQALEDELELTKSSVSTIQSMSNSLDSVVLKLRGNLSTTTANSLLKFNESMASTMLLSNGNDYKALEDSLKNTISYSEALNNADYFSSSRDMQFAQAIAANQFENMDLKLEDELSVLQQIADNTSLMIKALETTTSLDIYAQNMETSVKVKAFANGGIITGPTFGLIGEAGYSEAVIPLKNPNDPLGQKELIAEIKALRKDVAELKKSSQTTADNTTPSRYVS